MPSRKSQGSENESQPDSRRSSMRRFGSIASFQQLNPFARRRSSHITDNTESASLSKASLTSNVTSTAGTGMPSASSSQYQLPETLEPIDVPAPTAPTLEARRSSYICLPDDPIGGMPRSRTFSNLPLPTRARRNTGMTTSKSHMRLPSLQLPSTRIPSPPTTTRKHSVTGLTTLGSRAMNTKTRMKRSDTEPLLSAGIERSGFLPRSTAFEENITLSPIKPLPAMSTQDLGSHDAFWPTSSHNSSREWLHSDEITALPRSDSLGTSLPLSRYAQYPSAGSSPKFLSSPGYARQSLEATRPQPVQRWNSQPLLTNMTNLRRPSRYREITETRLMSARQAPTPPFPKTPLSAGLVSSNGLKSINNSGHLRQVSEASPLLDRSTPKPTPPSKSLHEVATPEPSAYWAGRISSLLDRYRNEELQAQLADPFNMKTKAETDKMHSLDASTKRMRRALEYLHGCCTTSEARESFVVFQLQFAALQNNAELSRPIQVTMPARKSSRKDREQSVGSEVGSVGSMGSVRKMSFMDRLLGRSKRSSIA